MIFQFYHKRGRIVSGTCLKFNEWDDLISKGERWINWPRGKTKGGRRRQWQRPISLISFPWSEWPRPLQHNAVILGTSTCSAAATTSRLGSRFDQLGSGFADRTPDSDCSPTCTGPCLLTLPNTLKYFTVCPCDPQDTLLNPLLFRDSLKEVTTLPFSM